MTAEAASLGDWLDRELESAPPELALRIRGALPNGWRGTQLIDGPGVLTLAATTELRTLLLRGCETRRAAPGLLAVDALITYACELIALTGANADGDTRTIVNALAEALPDGGTGA